MKLLLSCAVGIAIFNSFADTYVTNVIDEVVWKYRIDGTGAVVLRVELLESGPSDVRKSIVIPKTIAGTNVMSVADDALKDSYWLLSVTIPGSVTQIGDNAFANCSNLVSVILENDDKSLGLRRINSFAFCNCVLMDNINLAKAIHLSVIDRSAFEGCKSLKHIELPERLCQLDEFVFRGCENLQEVTLPVKVGEVPGSAFVGCASLREINIAPGGNYLFEKGLLYDKTKRRIVRCLLGGQVESLKLDEGVIEIAPNAFDGCKHLTSVILPSSLKHIGEFAFADSGLREIVLPGELKSIGYAAFANTLIKLDGRWAKENEL